MRPGHAIASELLPSVDKVQKVSIVPRGKALGYTLNLPQEDRYLKTRQELIDYMKVLLAGRVAEQITFGRITTGASDDLKRVTAIARSMVDDYAMGTHIRSHQVPSQDFTDLGGAPPDPRRGGPGDRRGGLPRRPPAPLRPPRPARRGRRAPARKRGHRARGDQGDHGAPTASSTGDSPRTSLHETLAARPRSSPPRTREPPASDASSAPNTLGAGCSA